MNARPSGLVRWPYLAAGVVGLLFAGIIYAWSILKAPLGEEFGWTASQLALNFTLTMCFFCLGGMAAGALMRRTSPRVTLLVSAALVFIGFFGVSRLGGSLVQLYFCYGVLGGLGIGMAYNAIISSTNAWFPDKKGTCSGALMMGFGASSLILGNVAGALLEPEALGWRSTYLVLGIAIAVVLAAVSFLVRLPPPGTALPQAGGAGGKAQEDFQRKDYTPGEMVRRFSFWRFFIFSITMSSIGNTVISLARDLALSVGSTAALATALVGVLSVCNGLGRIMTGILFDVLGRRRTMLLANTLTIAAPAVLLIAVLGGTVPLCVAGLCLSGLSYGCSPPISSAFVGAFYGMKHFALNFSIANTMLIPTAFTATAAGAMVTATGSYIAPVVLLLVFSLISLALNLSIRRP